MLTTALQRARKLTLHSRLQASYDAGDDAWTPHRLQTEISVLLAADGLRGIDLIKSWDTAGDGELDKKEYVVSMKRLCGGNDGESSEIAWYALARDAAMEAFSMMDKSGDKKILERELCHWLDPHGRLIAAGRRKEARAPFQPVRPADNATNTAGAAAELDPNEDALAYSPTKLSTRLAMVRIFDPAPPDEAPRRKRPPLWQPKEAPPPPPPPKPLPNGCDPLRTQWRRPGTQRPRVGLLSLEHCGRGVDASSRVTLGTRKTFERVAPTLVAVSSKPPRQPSRARPASARGAPNPLHHFRNPSMVITPRLGGNEWYDSYTKSAAATRPRFKAVNATEPAMPSSALAIKPWTVIAAEAASVHTATPSTAQTTSTRTST